jgi:uncharacterized protein YdhG (YjbR/CyaY superfamily)
MPTRTKNPIDTYLDGLTDAAAKKTLTALRNQLRKLLPDAEETLSYAMPAYRMPGGKVAAGFAFSGKNCGYYPHSGNIVGKLGDLLADHRTTPGAVSFPPDAPLKASLVKALVRARLEEISALDAAPPKPRVRAAAKRAAKKPAAKTPARKRAPAARRG